MGPQYFQVFFLINCDFGLRDILKPLLGFSLIYTDAVFFLTLLLGVEGFSLTDLVEFLLVHIVRKSTSLLGQAMVFQRT